MKKINEIIVTNNKYTANLAGLVTSGLRSDVARGPPVEQNWPIWKLSLKQNNNIG